MLLKLHGIGWEAYRESYIRRDAVMTYFMGIILFILRTEENQANVSGFGSQINPLMPDGHYSGRTIPHR
jgi:hypothetical protein